MATILRDWDFEGGTPGNAVSETDFTDNSYSAVYSSSNAHTGSRSCRLPYANGYGYGGCPHYTPWAGSNSGAAYLRAVVTLTTLTRRSGWTTLLGIPVAGFGYGLSGAVVHSDGSVSINRSGSPTQDSGVNGSNRTPASVVAADTKFRIELYSTGTGSSGTTTMRLFVGSNIDGTTADYTKVSAATEDGYYGTHYAGCGNQESLPDSHYLYSDRVAFATDGWIGPATSVAVVEATASLSATAALTTAAVKTSLPTASLAATASLTVAAVAEKLPAPTLAATASLGVVLQGESMATAALSAASALTTSGTVTASDFSSWIVGVPNWPSYGWVTVPAALIDGVATLWVTNANCQNLATPAIAVRFPYPATRDEPHALTINYKIRDLSRRVFVDIMKAYERGVESEAPYAGQRSADVFAPFRMDGFCVEPGPAIGADAAITYRWDTAQQAWYFDSWSGTTTTVDNRPNEMPEGMTPLYFSPGIRAHARFTEIRDRHVASLMPLPYWYHRFNYSSNFCVDITGPSTEMLDSIGARHSLSGGQYSATIGRTVIPVSICTWSLLGPETGFEQTNLICDGDTMLHEVGHLWDFQGMSYAGWPDGIQPFTYPGVPDIPSTPGPHDLYEYHPAPNDAVVSGELHVAADGTYYWLAYDTSGNYVTYGTGPAQYPAVREEAAVVDLYDQVPPDADPYNPNYYKSVIIEWVGQSFGYYLQKRTPSFTEQSPKSVYQFSTPALQAAFEAYMVDAGVIPFIDAMVATATLTAEAFVTRPASADLAATATLTTAAIVDIPAAATLSASSDLAVEGTVVVPAEATLTAATELTAEAEVIAVVWADAPLAAAATLTADAYVVRPATVTLTAASSLTSPSTTSIVASLPATSTLTASAFTTRFSTVSMSSAATLTAAAGVTLGGTVQTLRATATLTTAAIVIRFGNLEPDEVVGRGTLTSPAAPRHRLIHPASAGHQTTSPSAASHRVTGG